MMSGPSLAEVRAKGQPPEVLARLNDEHWFGRLYMRRAADHRPARMTKLAVLRELAARRTVAVMVDDDALVVRALREAGFTVLHAEWMAEQPSLFEAQETDGRT